MLSVAHCAQLEQFLVPPPPPVAEGAPGASASSSSATGASASSACEDVQAQRAEVKRGLQELSQGDLNFIPGDCRAHLVRAAAKRAVRKGDLTMLETCLRNFKARVSTALTCEIAAVWKKEPRPVLSLLLAHGAKLDGHAENRPLHHAVYCGNTHMVEALVEMKADPTKTVGGESPLHVAVRRGRQQAVRLLLNRGARADEPDPAGRTPHFLAEMAWRMHEVSCPGSPCNRCDERWGIRCQFVARAGGAAPEARLPQPRPSAGEAEERQEEVESEDSSTDWEDSGSDVSDMDNWASEEDDEEEGEEEEDGEDEDEEEEEGGGAHAGRS